MPSWYSDLVHLTKTRSDLTIEEKAKMLGMSKSGVANALRNPIVQSLISGQLNTEEVQTDLTEKSQKIEANLQQSQALLDRVKDMVIVSGFKVFTRELDDEIASSDLVARPKDPVSQESHLNPSRSRLARSRGSGLLDLLDHSAYW